MGTELTLTRPQNLKLYSPDKSNWLQQEKPEPKTPNEWFGQRYSEQVEKFGSPFLELIEPLDKFSVQVMPLSINADFFVAVLGGRKDLQHHTIYFEPERQWYFRDSDGIYKPTSPEKLANLYRALMMKCAQDLPANVHKLNLFHEFRSDKTAKAVVHRAKSILVADHTFFSASSPHQRIRGIELHERLARKFVDELLTCESGQILMLHDAYTAFCNLLKQRELAPLKRSNFKAIVVPLIRDEFNVALRNDLVVDGRQGVRGWKNVRLSQTQPD